MKSKKKLIIKIAAVTLAVILLCLARSDVIYYIVLIAINRIVIMITA